ncbi:MAG: ATP-binding cassette domain-containing protein [Ferruginibacter sp.]
MTAYTKHNVLLEAKNIQLSYGDQAILRDINFCIRDIHRPGLQQGQVVSLVGRSGIGKTQLFKILSGLQKPGSGTVTIYGKKNVEAGDMGVIFQNYYMFEWRTIFSSLKLAAAMNPALKNQEDAMIRHYAATFHIEEVLKKYPLQLSGGQRQRASIILQLLKGSDFLLLDEPFSGLDICVLDKVTELLVQVSLSDEKKTLIIVSHDISTAVAISDTVLILGNEPGKNGATIKKEIDLIERNLAWNPGIKKEKVFADTVEEIKSWL